MAREWDAQFSEERGRPGDLSWLHVFRLLPVLTWCTSDLLVGRVPMRFSICAMRGCFRDCADPADTRRHNGAKSTCCTRACTSFVKGALLSSSRMISLRAGIFRSHSRSPNGRCSYRCPSHDFRGPQCPSFLFLLVILRQVLINSSVCPGVQSIMQIWFMRDLVHTLSVKTRTTVLFVHRCVTKFPSPVNCDNKVLLLLFSLFPYL